MEDKKKGNKKEIDIWNKFDKDIESYLWFSSMISNNVPVLEGRQRVELNSKDEFGKIEGITMKISIISYFPDEAIEKIEEHAPKFIDFIRKLYNKYISVVNENKFIEIALNYFYDAQKKFNHNSNDGFISTMISLEALFNESPTNIKYKLSHRAAFLLGLCDEDPIEIFKKLKKIYDTRSNLVHGGKTPQDDLYIYLASTYTRRLLIIFLILLNNEKRKGISKRKLLEEIDHAMLDLKMRNSLAKEINDAIKDFELSIPRKFEVEGKDGKTYTVRAW